MKKTTIIFLVLFIMCSGLSFQGFAKSNDALAVIPDYQIVIDDSSIYYADSLYPFLNYKDVTYLPMTYEYARAMNLTTGWLEGTAFMVAFNPCDDKLPLYETTFNRKQNPVGIAAEYNIYVNGKKVDNSTEKYPLLNFRGVTYFPITWEYAVEEFGWKISFEDDVFKIYTENNTADRWSIAEKREDDVVLSLYYGKEVSSEDGNVKHDYITDYYSLDSNSDNPVKLDDYIEKETVPAPGRSVETTIDDGYVYYNGQKLDDIYIQEAKNDYIKPDGVEESGYTVDAWTSDSCLPLEVIDVRVNTYNYGKSGSMGRKENYTFIKVNEGLLSLGRYKTVENVYEMNGDIYFNTVDYAQTIFRHYLQNRRMWKLTKEGQCVEIRYGDYNSIKIIGKTNGKLYLKCLWAPENPMEDAPYSVSLVNDGYYTFDGEGIKFVSPYVYSDFDIVFDSGEIFAVNNVLDKITKCQISPIYY